MQKIVWPIALLLAGCGSEDDAKLTRCERAARGGPSLTLGTGDEAYEDIPGTGEVYFVQGIQGGYHIYGSFQASGVIPGDPMLLTDPDNPLVSFDVSDETGFRLAGFDDFARGLTDTGGGVYELVGEILVLGILAAEEGDGRAATVSVTVEDACGTVLSDARDVTLVFAGTSEDGT